MGQTDRLGEPEHQRASLILQGAPPSVDDLFLGLGAVGMSQFFPAALVEKGRKSGRSQGVIISPRSGMTQNWGPVDLSGKLRKTSADSCHRRSHENRDPARAPEDRWTSLQGLTCCIAVAPRQVRSHVTFLGAPSVIEDTIVKEGLKKAHPCCIWATPWTESWQTLVSNPVGPQKIDGRAAGVVFFFFFPLCPVHGWDAWDGKIQSAG
ncbi:hypothetical protein BX600DRAFT_300563 [Xylariales sp. PMI_506]|nr:hypothetical protein BX600DRAFT_300563 [Xylariales sp. PMI_506]